MDRQEAMLGPHSYALEFAVEDERPQELDRETVSRIHSLPGQRPVSLKSKEADGAHRTYLPAQLHEDQFLDSPLPSGDYSGPVHEGLSREGELKVLREQNESLKKANKRLVEETKELGRVFDRGLEQLKADLSATNAELETENGQLKRELSAAAVRLKTAEVTEDQLTRRLDKRDKEAASLADQLSLCRRELEALKAKGGDKAPKGRPVSDQSLALEIKAQRKTIADLEAENRRLKGHSEAQTRLNEDLRHQLAEIDGQLSSNAELAGRLARAEENGRLLRGELDRTLADLVRLNNRLGRTKALFEPSGREGEAALHGGMPASPAILRKSLLLLAEEVGAAAERHCVAYRDMECELLLQKDLAERAQQEAAELKGANAELEEERQALEQELGQQGEEVEALGQRVNELELERAALIAEKTEFLRQQDLEDRLAHAEAQLEKCLLEKSLLEFSAARLKKYIGDERLLFYIDSWSRLQGEAGALEKEAMGLELALARGLSGEDGRGDVEARLMEGRAAIAALDRRKAELEDRIRAVENENAAKLRAFDSMSAELARVG